MNTLTNVDASIKNYKGVIKMSETKVSPCQIKGADEIRKALEEIVKQLGIIIEKLSQ